MRIGMPLNYAGGSFHETAAELRDFEAAGLDIVSVPEAYSFDAVSQLGYLAAMTDRVELMAGIFQIYTRTPSLTAMTAAGMDYVSNGRFILGLGASNPQVIEGFHGVRYDAPLGRTREVIDICRQVWAREKVQHDGKHYQVPLTVEKGGSGLGKPLKLINHPVRDRIPVTIASLGPKNVELTAEIAEGWLPIFYYPERAQAVWGPSLAAGAAKRDPALPPLDTIVQAALAIGEDVEQLVDHTRPQIALYVGGMGARDKNFYNELAVRYGFEAEAAEIQDLYLSGKKEAAAKAVPAALAQGTNLIGPASYVAERIAAYAETGATTLMVTPFGADHAARVRLIERVKELAG